MTQARYPLHQPLPRRLALAGRPLVPVGPLRVYACGITPYDVTHVGHAATFVWTDLLASLAKVARTEPLVVRNVTDVDDVLTVAARDRGRPFDELALTQEFHFERDMRALSVAPPASTPHARGHVGAVIRLAAALLAAGAAYESGGFVYFRGADVPGRAGVGEARALTLSEQYGDQAGVPGRESRFDVAVWRPSSEADPAWPSPWGWGRPGWHAECAAMAVAALGHGADVLVGGADLAFPHHPYLTAMAEAATGASPFARSVLHVGEVRQGGAKMAKSTGNLTLVADLLSRHEPAAVRFALLHRPVDEPWECTEEVFVEAAGVLARLRQDAHGADPEPDDAVLDRLLDGLDVPAAVAAARGAGPPAVAAVLDLLKVR